MLGNKFNESCREKFCAFTLVEMLLALLVVSIILSASIPVISSRQKAVAQDVNQNVGMPIGGIILWTDMETLPDNTWLECDGSALPTGIEYEQARRVFGDSLPDLRDVRNYAKNLNDYLAGDFKNYMQGNINTAVPSNMIGIWGTTAAIPTSWAEATEYRGLFLRGHGSVTSSANWTDNLGNARSATTTHSSGAINVIQPDGTRRATGRIAWRDLYGGLAVWNKDHTVGAFFTITPATIATIVRQQAAWDIISEVGNSAEFDTSRQVPYANEIRPVNKAVKYIKHTALTLADVPITPNAPVNYRYIAKVRH